ncbi:cytochrome P450 [Saccharothrix sp. HUAS TT1]|uniref:cytochrome P450 n=1 Tax=unclassified Saccharothrix TaxID=2593673 RepID=UPI00345C4980
MSAVDVGTAALPEVLDGFDLTDHTRFADGVPHEVFARLRREAPVLRHPPGTSADGDPFWVLTRHADIVAAASDPVFSTQGGPGRAGGGSHLEDLPAGVLAGVLIGMMDDPRHARMKDVLAPAMAGPAAARYAERFADLADALVGGAVRAGRVDFMTDVSELYAVRAIATVLGVPEADWPLLERWGADVLGFVNRRTGVVDDFSRATFQEMQRYFTDFVPARRDDRAVDLGSALARGELAEGGPMTDREREANLALMFITGLEQPRNTFAGAVLTFAEHPEQWRLLREDRSLLPTAIEEVLRWNPPNPYNRRTATRDVELHDQVIRAGEKVTFWWPSANRDEAAFADPATVDITRNPNPHLSFGAGRHACLGAEVARRQIGIALEALLDRVEEIRLTGPVVHAPNNKHTVILRMPVELVPANASEPSTRK